MDPYKSKNITLLPIMPIKTLYKPNNLTGKNITLLPINPPYSVEIFRDGFDSTLQKRRFFIPS
jgi:hypothetical protein